VLIEHSDDRPVRDKSLSNIGQCRKEKWRGRVNLFSDKLRRAPRLCAEHSDLWRRDPLKLSGDSGSLQHIENQRAFSRQGG
jgi:hypothetical protein